MNRLIYLDETGVNIGMTRLYGRAPKGERIYEYVPDVRFNRVSVLSTIRVDGTTNPFVYSGTLNGFLFIQYIWLTCAFYSITPEQAENHFISNNDTFRLCMARFSASFASHSSRRLTLPKTDILPCRPELCACQDA